MRNISLTDEIFGGDDDISIKTRISLWTCTCGAWGLGDADSCSLNAVSHQCFAGPLHSHATRPEDIGIGI